MYPNGRTNQGGSVLVFAIIGVVLAAAIVGTVYFVRQQGEQVRSDTPLFEMPEATPESPAPVEDGDEATSEDTTQGTPKTVPGRSDAESGDDTTTKNPSDLPETGPAETLMTILVVAMLVFVSTSYYQSRHTVR